MFYISYLFVVIVMSTVIYGIETSCAEYGDQATSVPIGLAGTSAFLSYSFLLSNFAGFFLSLKNKYQVYMYMNIILHLWT